MKHDERPRRLALVAQCHADWDERPSRAELACAVRCDGCCYHSVRCTSAEAEAIVEYVQRRLGASSEWLRLRIDSGWASERRGREPGGARRAPCPFSSDRHCGIYPVRPLECRGREAPAGTSALQCRERGEAVWHEAALRRAEAAAVALQSGAREPMLEQLRQLWPAADPERQRLTPSVLARRERSVGSGFDETWLDDLMDHSALSVPLTLPSAGSRSGSALASEVTLVDPPVYDLCLPGEHRVVRLQKGSGRAARLVASSEPQEVLMTWEAAKRAGGRVLAIGLGLGVFSQLALSLGHVRSIEVVEADADVADLIERTWARERPDLVQRVVVHRARAEDFLARHRERFDSIYVDAWHDLFPERLPQINRLIELSQRRLSGAGEVLAWGWNSMVRLFLDQASRALGMRAMLCRLPDDGWRRLGSQQPLFGAFVGWLRENPEAEAEAALERAYVLAADAGSSRLGPETRPWPTPLERVS